MGWEVLFHPEFEREFDDLTEGVQNELLAHAKLLEMFGPGLGRPRVDTLKNSRHSNMKELRFAADGGVWRAAFAFDAKRRGIVLVAADKRGLNERRFYARLVATADGRFASHLARIREEGV